VADYCVETRKAYEVELHEFVVGLSRLLFIFYNINNIEKNMYNELMINYGNEKE
jgi:hypothetical protein